jgi:hypothetical protein
MGGAQIRADFFTTINSRMGKNAKVSATQVTGETWEVENLFVGDG